MENMTFSLNIPCESDTFVAYPGSNRTQMPKLLADGRVPLSVAGLMQRRIVVSYPEFGAQYRDTPHQNSVTAVRDAWRTSYFDTGDGVLYHPDGKIKVVLDAGFIRELDPSISLLNGAVKLAEKDCDSATVYDQINGEQFTRKQVEDDKFGTVWLALARGDAHLLEEYKLAVVADSKECYNHERPFMNIYLTSPQIVAIGRLWCVHSCYDYSGADAYGIDYSDGRLVGVRAGGATREARNFSFDRSTVVSGICLEAHVGAAMAYIESLPHSKPITPEGFRVAFKRLYKE